MLNFVENDTSIYAFCKIIEFIFKKIRIGDLRKSPSVCMSRP